jgi:hypothetical protein
MAASSPRSANWSLVPDNSHFHVGVSGTTAGSLITASGRVFIGAEAGTNVPDSALQPGPHDVLLRSPDAYTIDVDVLFATAGTATVTAEVVGPGGATIPQDNSPPPKFSSTVTGVAGQIAAFTFTITTKP